VDNELRETKLLLADVIEALAAMERRFNALSISVLASRYAMLNYDSTGRFEVQYEKISKAEGAKSKIGCLLILSYCFA
jgi:hypothetical protein